MGKLVVAAVTAGVAAFTLAAPVGADELQVRLHVTEPAGLARKGEPICGGIPLPKGMFRKDQPFAMLRAEGLEELACQTVPLVADPDSRTTWPLGQPANTCCGPEEPRPCRLGR
jgi:hypothetical protein